MYPSRSRGRGKRRSSDSDQVSEIDIDNIDVAVFLKLAALVQKLFCIFGVLFCFISTCPGKLKSVPVYRSYNLEEKNAFCVRVLFNESV